MGWGIFAKGTTKVQSKAKNYGVEGSFGNGTRVGYVEFSGVICDEALALGDKGTLLEAQAHHQPINLKGVTVLLAGRELELLRTGPRVSL